MHCSNRLAPSLAAAVLLVSACGDNGTGPDPDPVLDPLIAFTYAPTGDAAHIAVMNPDGTGLRVMTEGEFDNHAPWWSSDGATLGFASWRGTKSSLYTVPLSSGGEGTLLPTGPLSAYEADWKPDGSLLAIATSAGISFMNSDGSGLRELETPRQEDDPAWSPDGVWLAFTSLAPSEEPGLMRRSLFIVRPDGSGLRRLAEHVHSPINRPAWSPDGNRIVFVAYGVLNRGDLFVVTVASDEVEQLTATPEDEKWPDWSPDGSRIVYSRGLLFERQIYSMAADGSDVRQLTTVAGDHGTPRYRPAIAR